MDLAIPATLIDVDLTSWLAYWDNRLPAMLRTSETYLASLSNLPHKLAVLEVITIALFSISVLLIVVYEP